MFFRLANAVGSESEYVREAIKGMYSGPAVSWRRSFLVARLPMLSKDQNESSSSKVFVSIPGKINTDDGTFSQKLTSISLVRVSIIILGAFLFVLGTVLSFIVWLPGTCNSPSGYCVDPPSLRAALSGSCLGIMGVGIWLIFFFRKEPKSDSLYRPERALLHLLPKILLWKKARHEDS